MKKYIFFFFCVFIGIIYAYQNIGDRTDEDRLADAEYAFKDYLFESHNDTKYFNGPIIKDEIDGNKTYLWQAVLSGNRTVGIEVHVAKQKSIEPELIVTGKYEDWEEVSK